MATTLKYTVDTKPMANEIGKVSNHVTATTGAVVAMQAAVILAEKRAADLVCDNVNRGFYSLIRSQISQKTAKLQSEVDSHLMQLSQQKKALLAIKFRMERDFNMISNRYTKLFNGLNANLKQRVFELDKPTIDFAVKEIDKVSNRTKYLTAAVSVNQLESLSSSQKILASSVKYKGAKVIDSIKDFLSEMNAQKKLTDKILINDRRYVSDAKSLIPVLIIESNSDNSSTRNLGINISDAELSHSMKQAIQNKIYAAVSDFMWIKQMETDKDVLSEFSKLSETSNSSQRVKDMALKLFQSNKYETL
jgi:hypothetical protein